MTSDSSTGPPAAADEHYRKGLAHLGVAGTMVGRWVVWGVLIIIVLTVGTFVVAALASL